MQSAYRIDLILRAVEDEANKRLASKEDKDIVVWDLQLSFSRYWILSMYKALRIVEKGGQHATPGFDALYQSFRLLRVPLAKGQIAQDAKLSPGLKLVPIGAGAHIEVCGRYFVGPFPTTFSTFTSAKWSRRIEPR